MPSANSNLDSLYNANVKLQKIVDKICNPGQGRKTGVQRPSMAGFKAFCRRLHPPSCRLAAVLGLAKLEIAPVLATVAATWSFTSGATPLRVVSPWSTPQQTESLRNKIEKRRCTYFPSRYLHGALGIGSGPSTTATSHTLAPGSPNGKIVRIEVQEYSSLFKGQHNTTCIFALTQIHKLISHFSPLIMGSVTIYAIRQNGMEREHTVRNRIGPNENARLQKNHDHDHTRKHECRLVLRTGRMLTKVVHVSVR